MRKTDKIYVAGHKGLVGSAIMRRLVADGYVNVITRTRSELDLTDQRAVADFFAKEKPQYVFLAAAKVGGIWANNTYPAEFIYQNLMIQSNVIHQSYVHGITKLLFLGSSCVYPKLAMQPIKEEYLMTGPLEPTNSPYAMAKIAGIEMCSAYNRQYGTRFMAVMPTNLYGPNDNFDLESSHVLPAMIRKFHLAKVAARGDWAAIERDEERFGLIPNEQKKSLEALANSTGSTKVVLWGTGSPRREFLHVDDAADACAFLMENYDGNELVNIGTGSDLTIRELAEIIKHVVDFDGALSFDVSKPDGTLRKLLDVSRLRSLGWSPKLDLAQGISNTYQWYIKQV